MTEIKATRVTKKLPCGKSITLEGRLRMGEMRLWSEAERQGNLMTCYEYLAKIIVAWDFEGDPTDPTDPKGYDNLWANEYQQVNKAAGDYMTAEAASKN